MIYPAPRIYPLGDCYVAVEFGDTAEIELSFRVIALEQALRRDEVPGIVETIATARQLGIVLDRTRTDRAAIEAAVGAALAGADGEQAIRSRRHVVPVWYGDPWSREAALTHGVSDNLEFVAEVNGISTDEVIEILTGTDYWVSLVGFTPGTYLAYPFDRSRTLSAPKYETPRIHTPSRTIAVAGAAVCGYTLEGPGGYQMLGRAAIDVYQAKPTVPWIPEDGVLIRAGDRIRYRAVGPREYDSIREQMAAGTYRHEVSDDLLTASEVQAFMTPAG
jgi:urea carboxylase